MKIKRKNATITIQKRLSKRTWNLENDKKQ